MFYSFEMVLVGIILLSGMTAGGISLWIKRKKESSQNSLSSLDTNSESPQNF
jgi:hypothetical protein